MAASAKNRCLMAVTGNPGTGAVTCGAAIPGYQALGAGDDGNQFTVEISTVDSNGNPAAPYLWEVQNLSTYTNSSTSLSRSAGNVEDGSSGPGVLVNFTSGTQRVMVTPSAALFPNHIVTASDGATVTFTMNLGDKQAVTLGGNRTLALSDDANGQEFTIFLIQDGTGGRTVTWWSGITWQSGATPVLQSAIGAIDIFKFVRQASGVYFGEQFNTTPIPHQSFNVSQANQNLTTSLAALGNRFRLLNTDWDLSGTPTRTPQYRVCALMDCGGSQINTSDVLELDVYDPVGAASIVNTTLTAPNSGANNVYLLQTAWTNLPTSILYPYCRVRNQTGARGTAGVVYVEIRYR